MFLDNRQAAMDGLLEALADSLDYYQDNADRLQSDIREALAPCFDERRQDMRLLQQQARRHLDLLPRDADVERDDYLWLWSRLKSFVVNNTSVLIGELLEQERIIMQSLSTVVTHSLPDEMEPVMERLWKNCRGTIRELHRYQHPRRRQRCP